MYTAKCHGNLGRLFQSMKKFKVSYKTIFALILCFLNKFYVLVSTICAVIKIYLGLPSSQEAQNMQLKAIEIKEKIVGSEDYEVGLSVGHLASLYTYDMELHKEAEVCFLRSIEISK